MATRPVLSEPHQDDSLPLAGITVADFSWVLAGPRSTSWLGSMGARILKVEGPRRPDQYRFIKIFEPEKENIDGSGAFHTLNFSKYDSAIDFNTPRGLELAKQIVMISDVVVENFAYGVMERVGLGYEELRKLKPDIIFVSSSAMGKTGPDKHHVAYGNLIHAFSGLDSVTGYDGEAGSTGGTYADPMTGTNMVLAVLAALWHRRRTGQGQRIDLSMVEAALMQLPEYILDYTANGRVGKSQANDRPIKAPNDTYLCADGNWVAISIDNDTDWQAFCGVLGNPTWCRDERYRDQMRRYENREELNQRVGEWAATLTPAEVTEQLQAVDVSASQVYDAQMLYEDEHLQARNFYVNLDHPVVGNKPVVPMPWHIEPGPSEHFWPAPTFGQHTDYILHDLLGVDEAEIASLREDGIIV